MRLQELAHILGAHLTGPGDMEITGAAGVHEAVAGTVTFIAGTTNIRELEKSSASAALVSMDAPEMTMPLLRVKNPRLAFAQALELLYGSPYRALGISPAASIADTVTIGADCSIHPFSVLAENVRIGCRVSIHPGVYVGKDSDVGDDSVIFANVSIGHRISIGKRVVIHSGSVLGSDGFGFVTDNGTNHKIPQVGGVIIEDDVEIGANCSIDRATLGHTRIKKGTKLDNQVHVAHNVTIGEHCLIAGQVGIAGSTTLGNYVVFGGQVGVGDHVTIGDRVMAGGKAVIPRDVENGQVIAGFNAMPLREWLKVQAVLPKLPELKKQLAELQKQVKKLEERNCNTHKEENL